MAEKRSFAPLVTVIGIAVVGGILAFTSPGKGLINTSNAVQIPEALVLAFNALVLALLTAGFMYLLNTFGLDLTRFALPLSVSLSALLLALVQHWIDLTPAQYDPLLTMILNILVVVVGGLGTLFLVNTKRNSIL